MLSWVSRFSICCFMDNHGYNTSPQTMECLAGVGAMATYGLDNEPITLLNNFHRDTHDWIFGHFSYDLKNSLHQLSSGHNDYIGFTDAFLFVPEIVIKLYEDRMEIGVLNNGATEIYTAIVTTELPENTNNHTISLQARISKEEYLKTVSTLLHHIRRGDCYEVNFCQEFFAENVFIDPLHLYRKLTGLSPNPFATFYKVEHLYLLCASPERYLKKTGDRLLSQPIKGTWPRHTTDTNQDEYNRELLQQSKKDQSENVMIVDLVRNDLSQICTKGSVVVDELFGIYSFPQVYQMISSISGVIEPGTSFTQILEATFPMGSMTGAPKRRVMELIEQYEKSRRGLFSGAVGYITPEKDFDFNVVIRSIFLNDYTNFLSYQVGGGITSNSIPEKEYEECLLKAAAIRAVLAGE